MSWILGLSAFYHDSSVALLRDGQPYFAASEEAFSRKKHDAAFPHQALRAALDFAEIDPGQLDYVGFYEKPLLKFDRLLETYLAVAPRGYRQFAQAMPSWLRNKLHIPAQIRRSLGGDYRKRIVFCEHHEAHAASAFFPSPFDQAAILTVDGVGEWCTTTWGIGRGNQVELRGELRFPHSLGLLYSAFTYFCGFRVNSGEYKLMGLAPYGEPKYADLIRSHLVQVSDDGSYRLNMRYFSYCHSLTMTGVRLEKLLGFKRRDARQELRQQDMDLAASIQQVTEEIMLRMAEFVFDQTGQSNLVLAGGVALNCVANTHLQRSSPFDKIWIQPAAGDAGGALGVAQWMWYQLLNNPRTALTTAARQFSAYLGPEAGGDAAVQQLKDTGAVARCYVDDRELDVEVAKLLAAGCVVGWVQGRMEFGPRALGNRSILADARHPEMQSILNRKIKQREAFRPFAPAVLHERVHACFDVPDDWSSPYMLFTAPVHHHQRLPAITHRDASARIQTVHVQQAPRFHALLRQFDDLTGCPALLNTSFNVRGEPMVRTAAEAYRCFLATGIDALVIDKHLFLHSAQPAAACQASRHYLNQLELD